MWLGFLYSVPRVGSLQCLPGISLALCFPGFSLSREIPPFLSHLATGHLSLYYCSHNDASSHSKSKSSATPGPQFHVFSASWLPCYIFFLWWHAFPISMTPFIMWVQEIFNLLKLFKVFLSEQSNTEIQHVHHTERKHATSMSSLLPR